MESALISIVTIALVIITAITMTMKTFTSASLLSDSWREMEERAEEIRRTDIAAVPPENYGGGVIDILVINEGQTSLESFSQWDIIARYQTGQISYIDYTDNTTPQNNQWTLEGLYLSDNTSRSEIFDLNILNPGETAKLKINLDPDLSIGEYGQIIVSTSNGITSQCMVFRQ